jgi:hypothetical protein
MIVEILHKRIAVKACTVELMHAFTHAPRSKQFANIRRGQKNGLLKCALRG